MFCSNKEIQILKVLELYFEDSGFY